MKVGRRSASGFAQFDRTPNRHRLLSLRRKEDLPKDRFGGLTLVNRSVVANPSVRRSDGDYV